MSQQSKTKKTKVCCVFNYNPFYRYPIYKKIDESFDSDFYFGNTVFQSLKTFDPKMLEGFVSYIRAKRIGFKGYIWHSGISRIFTKRYTHYIITGDSSCIVNWLILLYGIIFHKKVFLWCHGLKDYVSKKHTRILCNLFFKSSAGILLYSKYSKTFMKDLGIADDKLFVIHNSLDTPKQTKIYSGLSYTNIYQNHFKNNNPTIIYIGRIQQRKKIYQILEALYLLKNQNQFINLVVVGDKVDGYDINVDIERLELHSQVWLYGPCYDENINAELIYNAKACVSPGNVGLTCIHSLSYGTPVLTNDNFSTQMPEFEAIIPNVTGSFFKENNIENLADEIMKWTSISDNKREFVRQECRKTILNEWSIDYQVSLLSTLIQK